MLFAEQQQRNKSPGTAKTEPPCLLAPANILRVRGRRARRWRETPRCAHGRTPVGARRARPSRKAVEKASAKPGKRRLLAPQPKFKTELSTRRSRTRKRGCQRVPIKKSSEQIINPSIVQILSTRLLSTRATLGPFRTTAKHISKTEDNRISVSPRPSKYPSSSGFRARRWHETPRRAHGRTPVGAR